MPFIKTDQLPGKTVIEGYEARTLHTGSMTLVYWSVQAGAVMPMHNHIHVQVAQVLQGQFMLTVNGATQTMVPGQIAVIPSNTKHGGVAITDCLLLDVFTPERDDYKF